MVRFRSKNPSDSPRDSRRLFLRLAMCLPALTIACQRGGAEREIRPGVVFSPVDLPVLDGGAIRLGASALPCLINFWATWCPPCRSEMASLNRLYRDYAARGLGIFAASVDEDIHLVREYVRQSPLAFPVLLDSGGKLASQLGVPAYPTTLLLDRAARVSSVWVGDRDWDAADIRATIDRTLAN